MFQVIGLALEHKPIVEVPICLRLFIIVPILLGDVLILFAVRRTHCLCQIPKWQTSINNFKLLCTKSIRYNGFANFLCHLRISELQKKWL